MLSSVASNQVRDVKFQIDSTSKILSIVEPAKRLIITSGDTSDVDGFLALAEYSKVLASACCLLLPVACLLF